MTNELYILRMELTPLESSVLQEIAADQDMSEKGVMRQALRVYQQIHEKRKKNLEMAFVDQHGDIVRPEIFGIGKIE